MVFSKTNTHTITNTATGTDTELKKFGLIFGPLAIAISIWQVTRGHWGHVYFFAPAGCYALVMALIKPRWVYPLRWVMETAFKALMWVVTTLTLALCFYLVFAPIGLIMRLFGKDLLSQRIDPEAATYWIEREARAFDPQHYTKQF